jgi:hypothetical protein
MSNTVLGPTDAAADFHRNALASGKACLEAAMDYLARGWSVVPCCEPDHIGLRQHAKTCTSAGKTPLVCWTEYKHRLAKPAEVEGWWRRWPMANVGVLLGRVSRLVAIDVDGPGAEELLLKLCGGTLPVTLEFTTPRPGRRLLFQIPDDLELAINNMKGDDGTELKFMGEGSMTIMPPSRHKSLRPYLWS